MERARRELDDDGPPRTGIESRLEILFDQATGEYYEQTVSKAFQSEDETTVVTVGVSPPLSERTSELRGLRRFVGFLRDKGSLGFAPAIEQATFDTPRREHPKASAGPAE